MTNIQKNILNIINRLSEQEYSNLYMLDNMKNNAFMIYCKYFNANDQLNEEEIEQLIKITNFNHANYPGSTPLMYAFESKIPLNKQQWDYIFKHSDLDKKSNLGYNAAIYFFIFNIDEKIIGNDNYQKLLPTLLNIDLIKLKYMPSVHDNVKEIILNERQKQYEKALHLEFKVNNKTQMKI